jgi:choline dehydrogenase-like flavoprotein
MVLNRLDNSGQSLQSIADVQRTTFSLDVVAPFVCNTWEEILVAQSESQFDAIVMGSAMYGAYTASKLFEFGKDLPNQQPRILVLEAGPFLIREHFQNLTRLGNLFSSVLEPLVEPNSQGRKINQPSNYVNANKVNDHHRCVGGKSLFWGGWTPLLTEEDLKQ